MTYGLMAKFQRVWPLAKPAMWGEGIRIADFAKRKHPGEWSVTASEINSQTDAYKTITDWSRNGVPGLSKVEGDKVINEAIRTYPNDWSSMIYRVNSASNRRWK